MSAGDSRGDLRQTRSTAVRPGSARLRTMARLLAELAPIVLAKMAAAALLWWLIFGAQR